MILVSKSRSNHSFSQLVEYISCDVSENDLFTHNFFSTDLESIISEFERNSERIKDARGSVMMYHEWISISPDTDSPLEKQEAALRSLMKRYVELRAPNQYVFGAIHHDCDHLHAHFLISSNAVGKSHRTSLSRAEFQRAKQELENFRLKEHPELGCMTYFDEAAKARKQQREADLPKLTSTERSYKTRSGQLSRKEKDRATILKIFSDASIQSEVELEARLATQGMILYQRGSSEGVECLQRGIRYRLKTLGVQEALLTTKTRLQRYAERQQALTRDQSRLLTPEQERGRS